MSDAEKFEKAITGKGYIMDSISRKDNSDEIKKVTGRVKVMRKILINGEYKTRNAFRRVRWDATGHCYGLTFNKRLRKYDLTFDA